MNRAELTGRLTADPKLQKTQSGQSVCHFTVASRRRYNKDKTDFIPCTAWSKTAEFLAKYGRKGMQIGVEGSNQVDTYTDRNTGANQTRMEIMVENVEILEKKQEEKPVERDYDPVFDANWDSADFQPSQQEEIVSFDDLPF